MIQQEIVVRTGFVVSVCVCSVVVCCLPANMEVVEVHLDQLLDLCFSSLLSKQLCGPVCSADNQQLRDQPETTFFCLQLSLDHK